MASKKANHNPAYCFCLDLSRVIITTLHITTLEYHTFGNHISNTMWAGFWRYMGVVYTRNIGETYTAHQGLDRWSSKDIWAEPIGLEIGDRPQ